MVDQATARLINEEVAALTEVFIGRGRVEYEDETLAEGLRVRAYDRDLGTTGQELDDKTERFTNAGGVVPEVQYKLKAYEAWEANRAADLVFTVESPEGHDAVELMEIRNGSSEETIQGTGEIRRATTRVILTPVTIRDFGGKRPRKAEVEGRSSTNEGAAKARVCSPSTCRPQGVSSRAVSVRQMKLGTIE